MGNTGLWLLVHFFAVAGLVNYGIMEDWSCSSLEREYFSVFGSVLFSSSTSDTEKELLSISKSFLAVGAGKAFTLVT